MLSYNPGPPLKLLRNGLSHLKIDKEILSNAFDFISDGVAPDMRPKAFNSPASADEKETHQLQVEGIKGWETILSAASREIAENIKHKTSRNQVNLNSLVRNLRAVGFKATLIEVQHKNDEKEVQAVCYALNKGFGGNAVCPVFDSYIPIAQSNMRHPKIKYVTLYLVLMGPNSTLDKLRNFDPVNFSYGYRDEPSSIQPPLIKVRCHYPISSEGGLHFQTLALFASAGAQYYSLKAAGPTTVKRLLTEKLIDTWQNDMQPVEGLNECDFIINLRFPDFTDKKKYNKGKKGKGKGKGAGAGAGSNSNSNSSGGRGGGRTFANSVSSSFSMGKKTGVVFLALEGFATTAMAEFMSRHVNGTTRLVISIERPLRTAIDMHLRCVSDASQIPGIIKKELEALKCIRLNNHTFYGLAADAENMILRLSQCILLEPFAFKEIDILSIVSALANHDPPIKIMTDDSWSSEAFRPGIVHPKGSRLIKGSFNPSYGRNGDWANQAQSDDYVALLVLENHKQSAQAVALINRGGSYRGGKGWVGQAYTVSNFFSEDGVTIDGNVMNDAYVIGKIMDRQEDYFERITSTLRRNGRIPASSSISQWAAWSVEEERRQKESKSESGASSCSSLADMFMQSSQAKKLSKSSSSVSRGDVKKSEKAQQAIILSKMKAFVRSTITQEQINECATAQLPATVQQMLELRNEMLAEEAGKTATATAREVVPQLVQTRMSSPDPKALEKEREDRRRKEKETERRNDLEAMAREKRENDEVAEAKEAQEALRALKERELNADKLRVAAAEAKKTAEDALANLEAAEAAAKAQEGVSAERAVYVVDETGGPVSRIAPTYGTALLLRPSIALPETDQKRNSFHS